MKYITTHPSVQYNKIPSHFLMSSLEYSVKTSKHSFHHLFWGFAVKAVIVIGCTLLILVPYFLARPLTLKSHLKLASSPHKSAAQPRVLIRPFTPFIAENINGSEKTVRSLFFRLLQTINNHTSGVICLRTHQAWDVIMIPSNLLQIGKARLYDARRPSEDCPRQLH